MSPLGGAPDPARNRRGVYDRCIFVAAGVGVWRWESFNSMRVFLYDFVMHNCPCNANDARYSSAVSCALAALAYIYMRRRLDIDPDQVYRRALLRLNTHPEVLQRMGAPLVSSGGPRLHGDMLLMAPLTPGRV